MSVLVVLEHDGIQLRRSSYSAVSVAHALAEAEGSNVEALLIGHNLTEPSAEAARLLPTTVAGSPLLLHPTADRYSRIIASVAAARMAKTIVAASTTFAKDILPRVAAQLQASMASDVTAYQYDDRQLLLQRPMYAGAVTATVMLVGSPKIITIRASAFAPAEPLERAQEVTPWSLDEPSLPQQIEFVSLESRPSSRPDVTDARVVVSGGRAFRTPEELEQYVGKLADVLGGAIGCTRPLVDAGIAANEWQVGQTGKVVAPDLYFALGISGAVQHLAGMKNSRVVVAINSDPDAPIFNVANYGLVGDVRNLVPQLIQLLATLN